MAHRLFEPKTLAAIVSIALGAFLLGFIFWSFDAVPMWAITSFVLVYDPDMRAALSAGLSRLWFTVLGTGIALACISIFGLHKWLMPLSLAVAAIFCGGLLNTRIAIRIVLVSVALIVGSSLLEPADGLHIALTRALEVSVGSLMAIAFSSLVTRLTAGASNTTPAGSIPPDINLTTNEPKP